MSIEVWGQLPKAQDDAQTIQEAIDASILAHEEDPASHLGTGKSLENHKTNGTIDHPASSIVPDKFSNNQPTYQEFFAGSSSHYTEGNVLQSGGGMISFIPTSGSRNTLLSLGVPFIDRANFPLNDIIADFSIEYTKSSGVVNSGGISIGDHSTGFGIEWNTTQIRLFYAFEDTVTYSSWLTKDISQVHTYRLYLSVVDSSIFLFVDGVQVLSLSIPDDQDGFLYEVLMSFNMPTGNTSQMNLAMFRMFYNI